MKDHNIDPEKQPGFYDNWLIEDSIQPEILEIEEQEDLDPELKALWESIKNEDLPNYYGKTNTLAQTSQHQFTWTDSHDCEWVHRRQRMSSQQTFNQIATSGTRWVDETLPLIDAIQWPDTLTGSRGNLSSYATNKLLKWLRISDYFSASRGYSLYGINGYANRADIKQGAIGNCWLVAGLASIAE